MSLFGSILSDTGTAERHALFNSNNKYFRPALPTDGQAGKIEIPNVDSSEFVKNTEKCSRGSVEPKTVAELGKQTKISRNAADRQLQPPRKKQKAAKPEQADLERLEPASKGVDGLRTFPSKKSAISRSGQDIGGEVKVAKAHDDAGRGNVDTLRRTVFVGNLPPSSKRKNVKAIFSACGPIESVRLRSVPIKLDKMLPRRAAILCNNISSEMGPAKAFVVFKDEASIAVALSLNMKEVELLVGLCNPRGIYVMATSPKIAGKVDGHHIRVDKAQPPSSHAEASAASAEYDRSCSIFLGNLPFDVTDEEVIRLFSGSEVSEEGTSVKAVRIVRDPATNIGKGFGYVLFTNRNAALMALAKDSLKLRKRSLRVTAVIKQKKKPARGASSDYNGPTGAEGRLKRKAAGSAGTVSAAVWQGVRTKGAGKTVRTVHAVKGDTQAPQKCAKQKVKAGSDGKSSKRPAVAARKARSLGKPVPAIVKKRRPKGEKQHTHS